MGAIGGDANLLAMMGAAVLIYLGWACWLLVDSKAWKKFWIGWIVFWFLPIAFRILSTLYLGSIS